MAIEYQQAEQRFQELQARRDSGDLDETAYRVEVAKLLFRDERGVFWMLDADSGDWFCNRGQGWQPGDPRAEESPPPERRARQRLARWRSARALTLTALVVVLVGLLGVLIWRGGLGLPWGRSAQPAGDGVQVQVTIASPATGSQVPLGHEVAVESTIDALPSLAVVDHVDLVVAGVTVDQELVRPRVQPQQTSLPLSQPWLPTAVGEYQVAVVAFSGAGEPLGVAAIHLQVTKTADQVVPEPGCVPDATFVADVTIPAGTAFPPGTPMDKVWQVRNSGTCAWGVGYELVFVRGESLDAPPAVPVPSTAAGEPADLTVTFWAPEEPGSYASVWQMQSPNGEFFGPLLTLDIRVEARAEESAPPAPPTDLEARLTDDGQAVQLTWLDRSDNEDAFRIYRADVEASIGLAPADTELFVDSSVSCGHTYQYAVAAFNAAGSSPLSETVQVTLPACALPDEPPTVSLTVVPTEVLAGGVFTVTFQADDDLGLSEVTVRGEETGEPALDEGRVFRCPGITCVGIWAVQTSDAYSGTLRLVSFALDSSEQASEPAWAEVLVLPVE